MSFLRSTPVALAVLALSGCAPAVQGTLNPPRFATIRRAVVLPFAVPDGAPPTLAGSLADELSAHLDGARYSVVEPAVAIQELREGPAFDVGDPAAALRLGELLGVDAVIVGRVSAYHDRALSPKVATSLAISVRVVDLHTREVVLSTSSDATAALSFCDEEMTCLCGKMMAAVGRFVATGS
jgi:hypothetical protein